MLIGWWTTSARAVPDTDTGTCGVVELDSTLPADGDTNVLPEAVIAIVHRADGSACGGAFFSGDLQRSGVSVPFTLETDPSGLVLTLIPDEPLLLGETYVVDGDAAGGRVHVAFTVGDEGLATGEPPSSHTLAFEQFCGAFAYTTVTQEVTFAAPLRGLLQTRVVADGIAGAWRTLAALDARTTYGTSEDVIGSGLHLCVQSRLLDETGAEVWQADGDCASPERCPTTTEDERTSCSTAGGGGAWWLGAWLVVSRVRAATGSARRSRSARPPPSSRPSPGR